MQELLDSAHAGDAGKSRWRDEEIAARSGLGPRVVAFYRAALFGSMRNPQHRALAAAFTRVERAVERELAPLLGSSTPRPGREREGGHEAEHAAVRSFAVNLIADVRAALDVLDAEAKRAACAEATERMAAPSACPPRAVTSPSPNARLHALEAAFLRLEAKIDEDVAAVQAMAADILDGRAECHPRGTQADSAPADAAPMPASRSVHP